jgi:hypothetical protein
VNFGCGQSEYNNVNGGQTSLRRIYMYGLRWDEEAAASASDSRSGLSKGRGAPGTCVLSISEALPVTLS